MPDEQKSSLKILWVNQLGLPELHQLLFHQLKVSRPVSNINEGPILF